MVDKKCRVFECRAKAATQQRGAILVVCLIFLVVFTAMAVGGMETSIVEEKMSGNMQDYNRAFQAAETSLQGGEDWLRVQSDLPLATANGAYNVWTADSPSTGGSDPWWLQRNAAWWGTNGVSVFGNANVQPQYLIEEYHVSKQGNSLDNGAGYSAATERTMHRITARGTGNNQNAEVLIQGTYIRYYE